MIEKLTIGQLAAIFEINIQTLYYYDKIGLLVPSFRDSASGNRRYSFKQVQQLSTILYLKKCGFSLEEIREIESNLTPEIAKEQLLKKSEVVMKQCREIIKLDEAIHKKLKYVDDEMVQMSIEDGQILHRESRYYLEVGIEETAYKEDALYYYPLVVCYYTTKKVFGALLEKKDSLKKDRRPVITIPDGSYLIKYHRGPYTSIPQHQEKIMKKYSDLKFTGDVFTFDIVDQMNCANIDDFITKMEFEIQK